MQKARRPHEDDPQEELLAWLLRLWETVEDNYPKIFAGIGVVAVAVIIVVFVQRQNTANERAAQEALGEVYVSLFQGEVTAAIAKAEGVLNEYGSEPAAREALMAMANLNFEEGRIDQARGQFQKYLDDNGSDGPLGYGAWSGLAACLEQEQKFNEAGDRLKSYAEKHPDEPFAAVALKEAGRCYELAGNQEKAQGAYRQVLDQYAASPVANVARGKLQMMGADLES